MDWERAEGKRWYILSVASPVKHHLNEYAQFYLQDNER